MSLFDSILGNTRKAKPKMDGLFALPTAAVDLEAAGIHPTGVGAVCIRAPEGSAFHQAIGEAGQTLALYLKEHDLTLATPTDSLGFTWWVLEAPGAQIDDVATGLHLLADELRQRDFGDAIVAAAFPMEEDGEGPFTLVYNYRRGLYYPFAPAGSGRHERDNARELRLADILPASLPKEGEIDRWYALWDAPLGRGRPTTGGGA